MDQVTKTDIAKALAKHENIKGGAKGAKVVIEAVAAQIVAEVAKGNKVSIADFAIFTPADQAARTGTIPGTKKTYTTDAKTIVKIKPSKTFKDAVAG